MTSQISGRTTARQDGRDTPARWFDRLSGLFDEAAASASGAIDHVFQLDCLTIRVRFAGSALISRIWPALEHLAVDETPAPDLTVLIWDSLSSKTPMPAPPWTTDDYGARGRIAGFNDGRIYTNVDTGLSLLRMLDAERNMGLFWCRDVGHVPQHEAAAPLRTILSWWMGLRGFQLSHCAAVGTADGGALLVGQGGSGKSTTALLCLASGLSYAGDDFCVISQQSRPFVYSLYNTAKISRDNLHRIPPYLRETAIDGGDPEEEKSLLSVWQSFPEKLATAFPVRVILVPQVSGNKDTAIRAASPADALRALAPSSLFLRPDSGSRAFREMANLVKAVPAYHLELGSDLEHIPLAIADLLAEESA
jgi:hypothetical protein